MGNAAEQGPRHGMENIPDDGKGTVGSQIDEFPQQPLHGPLQFPVRDGGGEPLGKAERHEFLFLQPDRRRS